MTPTLTQVMPNHDATAVAFGPQLRRLREAAGITQISSGGGTSGGVVKGEATDPSCAPGTLVPVGPGTDDQDDDNEGGFPTDGDGCL